jgi:lysozyme family protein
VEANFDKSLDFVLASEGGSDDDAQDPGGRTSRGITQNEYSAWLKEQGRPDNDVWSAPQSDIDTMYHDEYWRPWCDVLPNAVDYMFFDMAVNAGPYRATVLLQQALGVTPDGRIGPITRAAIAKCVGSPSREDMLISRFTALKKQWYLSLHDPHFIKGWLNRCAEVEKNALSMLGG